MVEKHRSSIRLKKYDYSNNGWYFVTICTQNRECFFGDIVDNKMILNIVGIMVKKLWKKIIKRFMNIKLDTFQLMPNHIHGIIIIESNNVGAGLCLPLIQKLKGQPQGLPLQSVILSVHLNR